jgi:hypothetical protein
MEKYFVGTNIGGWEQKKLELRDVHVDSTIRKVGTF